MAARTSSYKQGSPGNSIHFERYYRNKSGKTIQEIAKEEKVSEKAIQKSIHTVELFRQKNTPEFANEVAIGVVIERMSETSRALQEALTATNEIQVDRNGKTVIEEIPDHVVRLQAVSKVTEILKTVQPKVGPQTNVQVGVGIQNRIATGPYIGMEDRLRELRKKRNEQPLMEGRTVKTADLDAASGDFATDEDDAEDEG